VQWRIKKAARRYKNSDASIFLTFSHASFGYSDAPVILFCDWTSDYYFKYFLHRPPLSLERYTIKRQDKKIEKADVVVSLFPSVTDYMRDHYKNKNIFYLGNVVNSELSASEPEVLFKKLNSTDILFIGNKKYKEGALCLIKAFSLLRSTIPDCKVHIIGMESAEFDALPDGVICYGYLDKASEEQGKLYYSLLQQAKAVVNTTEKWGAFSSTIEAMYFYNPVITTPYKEFTQTFGNDIRFGYYCESNSVELLHTNLVRLFRDPEYKSLCINAHEAVKPFTWDAYMENLLEKIRNIPQK
jgi:glycosyltransferase involved in cell wall biosynthesis